MLAGRRQFCSNVKPMGGDRRMGTDSSKLQGEKEYETDPLSQRLSISGRYISESPGVLLPTYSQKGQYILLTETLAQ